MKKQNWLKILTVLVLAIGIIGSARATIIPPHGEGQIGLQAVVLCSELTMRQSPNASAKTVMTLQYGDLPNVIRQEKGWAYCSAGDSEDSPMGWVNADYLAIDPAWYRTNAETPVYAWNDTEAPRVALLGKNDTLPVLKEEGDWLIVSLRGAVGWIHKTAAD